VADTHVIQEESGTITLAAAVLAEVVARSAAEVDGARLHRRRRGLEIDVSDGRVRVALELSVRYGEVLPEVAGGVQLRVADGLSSMCGLDVDAVDVSVGELERA
jgi:uncharacterized alkaline shock family protein YloU